MAFFANDTDLAAAQCCRCASPPAAHRRSLPCAAHTASSKAPGSSLDVEARGGGGGGGREEKRRRRRREDVMSLALEGSAEFSVFHGGKGRRRGGCADGGPQTRPEPG